MSRTSPGTGALCGGGLWGGGGLLPEVVEEVDTAGDEVRETEVEVQSEQRTELVTVKRFPEDHALTCVNDLAEDAFSFLLSAVAREGFCTVWWVLKTLFVTIIFLD